MADYYDDIVKDVIVFDTEIHWNYMWILNERYHAVKDKYENMYTVSQCFKKIFSLFKKQQDE
jgi:protoheme ferro-lyase